MATTGSVYVDARLKDPRGNVVAIGRLLSGQNATFDAADFQMRTIKSVVITAWEPINTTNKTTFVPGSIGSQAGKEYRRGFITVSGSIGSLDALNNYLRLRMFRVSTIGTAGVRTGAQGTRNVLYIGTQAGSIRASYMAVGR